jgi:branched-chain amino acid transport system ATP-binding protein
VSDQAIPPALEVRELRKAFGGVVALDGVSLVVPAGQVTGLIGPNGSGKTTLVNVVSGLMRSTSGEVLLHGRPITGRPAFRVARMGLARTFQVARPLSNMTLLENVAVSALFGKGAVGGRSFARALDEARRALDQVGLKRGWDEPAAALALLDRKRLELARALASGGDVVLLDEVLAGLRVRELDEAIELVRSINTSGVTLLIIEHVLRAVVSLCHQVVVIDRGRKIAEGPTAEVMQNPVVVAAYLGSRAAERPGGIHAGGA